MARYKVKGKDCQLKVKVKLSFKEEIDERQLDFFSSKYIRGLLKVQAKKKNCIEFYGPIGISLFDRLKKPISKYDFFFIMEQVVDITQKANLNSLILRNVVWDIHYVFINETTKELQFIYLPLTNDKKEADVLRFMEQIIYASKTMEEADTEYISRYVYFLKSLTSYEAEKIEKYILDIIFATRYPEKYKLADLKPLISFGASPRGSINLATAAKCYAFIKRRGYVIPEDVRAVVYDVLRHRIGITYEAEAENVTTEDIISRIVNEVEVP